MRWDKTRAESCSPVGTKKAEPDSPLERNPSLPQVNAYRLHPSRLLKNTMDFSYKGWVFEKKEPERQEEFWIETRRLPKLSAGRFFQRVEEVLAEVGFGEQVHRLCRPA
jgi:hypothetical protein